MARGAGPRPLLLVLVGSVDQPMEISRVFGFTASALGMCTCSTPFWYSALMPSAVTVYGRRKLRVKALWLNSRRV